MSRENQTCAHCIVRQRIQGRPTIATLLVMLRPPHSVYQFNATHKTGHHALRTQRAHAKSCPPRAFSLARILRIVCVHRLSLSKYLLFTNISWASLAHKNDERAYALFLFLREFMISTCMRVFVCVCVVENCNACTRKGLHCILTANSWCLWRLCVSGI